MRTNIVQNCYLDIFWPILEELCKYNDFPSTNMLVYEIFSSIRLHNLQSIFTLFRTFMISFVLEHRNYSITQQKKKLNTFEKTLNELKNIFDETNHFEYGEFQFKMDAKNEKIDISKIKFSEHNCATWESYKNLIQYCNKIAHCEIRFKNNDDTNSVNMAHLSRMVISYTISLISNIVHNKITLKNI